jgi:hypothetical protein
MDTTSDYVVSSYLDSLLIDLLLPEARSITVPIAIYSPQDSIATSQRLVPCFDPFLFMDITVGRSRSQHWLVYILVLRLGISLPPSVLKRYCHRQCQTLINYFNVICP